MRLGLIQVPNDWEMGLEDRFSVMYRLAEKCLMENADLVFFPEAFQHVRDRDIIYRPEELKRVSLQWKERCASLAKKYHAYVVPWDYERDESGKIYNFSYVLDRDGNEIGKYRKSHLTYTELERGIIKGTEFPVFELDFGTIGIMICFDNYWPETARCLALNGAQLILYPLYGDTLVPQWEIKMRARAIDNTVYIASCQIDNKFNVAYTGLVNPQGDVVCKLDEENSYRVVELELGKKVLTSTGGDPDYQEDIALYLRRCRNAGAYGPILRKEETQPQWEEIFQGKLPGRQ